MKKFKDTFVTDHLTREQCVIALEEDGKYEVSLWIGGWSPHGKYGSYYEAHEVATRLLLGIRELSVS